MLQQNDPQNYKTWKKWVSKGMIIVEFST